MTTIGRMAGFVAMGLVIMAASPERAHACVPGSLERCNGVDDDCDGLVDEGFTGLGQSCTAGDGLCANTGVKVCSADGTAVVCNAVATAQNLQGVHYVPYWEDATKATTPTPLFTQFNITNPSAMLARIKLTLYDTQGNTVVTSQRNVNPGALATIESRSLLTRSASGYAKLEFCAPKVLTAAMIVQESATNYDPTTTVIPDTSIPRFSPVSCNWQVLRKTSGSTTKVVQDAQLMIVNPNDGDSASTTANVVVTMYNGHGDLRSTQNLTIGPKKMARLTASALNTSANDARGVFQIRWTNAQSKSVPLRVIGFDMQLRYTDAAFPAKHVYAGSNCLPPRDSPLNLPILVDDSEQLGTELRFSHTTGPALTEVNLFENVYDNPVYAGIPQARYYDEDGAEVGGTVGDLRGAIYNWLGHMYLPAYHTVEIAAGSLLPMWTTQFSGIMRLIDFESDNYAVPNNSSYIPPNWVGKNFVQGLNRIGGWVRHNTSLVRKGAQGQWLSRAPMPLSDKGDLLPIYLPYWKVDGQNESELLLLNPDPKQGLTVAIEVHSSIQGIPITTVEPLYLGSLALTRLNLAELGVSNDTGFIKVRQVDDGAELLQAGILIRKTESNGQTSLLSVLPGQQSAGQVLYSDFQGNTDLNRYTVPFEGAGGNIKSSIWKNVVNFIPLRSRVNYTGLPHSENDIKTQFAHSDDFWFELRLPPEKIAAARGQTVVFRYKKGLNGLWVYDNNFAHMQPVWSCDGNTFYRIANTTFAYDAESTQENPFGTFTFVMTVPEDLPAIGNFGCHVSLAPTYPLDKVREMAEAVASDAQHARLTTVGCTYTTYPQLENCERPLWLLDITDGNVDNSQKAVVWVNARKDNEVSSQFILEGIYHELLSDPEQYLSDIRWLVSPTMNPDVVHFGRTVNNNQRMTFMVNFGYAVQSVQFDSFNFHAGQAEPWSLTDTRSVLLGAFPPATTMGNPLASANDRASELPATPDLLQVAGNVPASPGQLGVPHAANLYVWEAYWQYRGFEQAMGIDQLPLSERSYKDLNLLVDLHDSTTGHPATAWLRSYYETISVTTHDATNKRARANYFADLLAERQSIDFAGEIPYINPWDRWRLWDYQTNAEKSGLGMRLGIENSMTAHDLEHDWAQTTPEEYFRIGQMLVRTIRQYLLPAPANFQLQVTGCHVAYDWQPVEGAAGYEIHWGYTSGSHPRVVDMGNVTHFEADVDYNANSYSVVKAYNVGGAVGAPSIEVHTVTSGCF